MLTSRTSPPLVLHTNHRDSHVLNRDTCSEHRLRFKTPGSGPSPPAPTRAAPGGGAPAPPLTDIVHHDALPLLGKCLPWKRRETERSAGQDGAQAGGMKVDTRAEEHPRLFSPSPGVMISMSTPILAPRFPSSRPPYNASGGGVGGGGEAACRCRRAGAGHRGGEPHRVTVRVCVCV